MVVRGQLKKYIGAIESEHAAGLLYDKYAIIIQGLKVSKHSNLTNKAILQHALVQFLQILAFLLQYGLRKPCNQ